MGRVVVYTRSGCSECTALMNLLRCEGVPFFDINIDNRPERKAELLAFTGRTVVPMVFFNTECIGSLEEIKSLVDGYDTNSDNMSYEYNHTSNNYNYNNILQASNEFGVARARRGTCDPDVDEVTYFRKGDDDHGSDYFSANRPRAFSSSSTLKSLVDTCLAESIDPMSPPVPDQFDEEDSMLFRSRTESNDSCSSAFAHRYGSMSSVSSAFLVSPNSPSSNSFGSLPTVPNSPFKNAPRRTSSCLSTDSDGTINSDINPWAASGSKFAANGTIAEAYAAIAETITLSTKRVGLRKVKRCFTASQLISALTMYLVKKKGRERVPVYSPSISPKVVAAAPDLGEVARVSSILSDDFTAPAAPRRIARKYATYNGSTANTSSRRGNNGDNSRYGNNGGGGGEAAHAKRSSFTEAAADSVIHEDEDGDCMIEDPIRAEAKKIADEMLACGCIVYLSGQGSTSGTFAHSPARGRKSFNCKTIFRFMEHGSIENGVALNNTDWNTEPRSALAVAANLKHIATQLLKEFHNGNSIDFDRLRVSPAFAEYVACAAELQVVDWEEIELSDNSFKIALFINLYNSLAIHAMTVFGVPESNWQRKKLFSGAAYDVGGFLFTLNDIENGILRANRGFSAMFGSSKSKSHFKESDPRSPLCLRELDPRIHFALHCGALSCPSVQIFSQENLENEIEDATRRFIASEVSITGGEGSVRTITLSRIFKWFSWDFGDSPEERLLWIAEHAPSKVAREIKAAIKGKEKFKINYSPYIWTPA